MKESEIKMQKEKLTTDEVQNEFVPSVSIGPFVLGSNVSDYFDKKYEHMKYRMADGDGDDYDSYFFQDYDIYITTKPDELKIDSITAETSVIWNEKNLIGMKITKFMKEFPVTLYKVEKGFYIMRHDQNQTVYDFENPDIQVWTWWGKIVTVIISEFSEDN